jgi:transporter family-2 protein
LLIFGHPSQLSGLGGFRPQHAIGGLGGAAVVLVSLIAVRTVGIAGVAALLIFGQLVIAVVADRLGLFGVTVVGLTPGRWAGIVLVAAGTLLITRP